jgi:FlaG/FlaF family flagellin (archaellin)
MNGLKNIDFGSAVFSTALGVGTAYLGGQINQALAPYMSKWLSGVSDRIAYNALSQGLSNSISGFGIGTTFSLLNGDDFGTALYNGGKGAVTGFGLGVISGTVESIKIQRQIKDDNLKAPLKTLEAKNSQVTSNQSTTNSGEIIYYRGGNSFNMSKADLTSSVDKTTGLMNGRRGVSLNSDKMNPNVQKYGGAWEVDMKTFPSDLKIKPTTNTHFEIVPRNQGMTLSTYQDLLKTIKLEPYNKR